MIYYILGYVLGSYVMSYMLSRFVFKNAGTDEQETVLTVVGSLFWPFVIILCTGLICYNTIKKHSAKLFLPMDIIINSTIYIYKKSTEYVETKYISYKRRGYKPYVQANNNRNNVQSNVR